MAFVLKDSEDNKGDFVYLFPFALFLFLVITL
jgi:hypothetical protein